MARKRKKKTAATARHRPTAGSAQRVKPTPQTAARLKPDPLWTLLKKGVLGDYQIEAAFAIRAAYHVITRPVQMRLAPLERIDGGREPDAESARAILLQRRYNDWVEEMTRYRWPVGPILDIVVEGQSCREVDRARRVRNGRSRELLCDGLDLYCRLAGWPVADPRLAG